ncbi:MAG: hypothetical protein U1D33_04770 [bacterium]|nr:hypothetical protein [bacterium]
MTSSMDLKKKLIFAFAGGIVFFGLLAALTVWQQKREIRLRQELIAQTDLAATALNGKNFETAFKEYETLYKKAGSGNYFRVLALHGMGTSLRGSGDYKAALTYFERAAKEPENPTALYSRFEAARTLSLAQDPEAKKAFEDLLQAKNLPADLKQKIEEQLSWLSPQKKS